MEGEQSGTFGGGGEDSSGSDTLSEGETRAESYQSHLQFEEFQCYSSDFVGLEEKVKGNYTDDCSDEIKARNGDHQEEGENEGDEDEMVKYINYESTNTHDNNFVCICIMKAVSVPLQVCLFERKRAVCCSWLVKK